VLVETRAAGSDGNPRARAWTTDHYFDWLLGQVVRRATMLHKKYARL